MFDVNLKFDDVVVLNINIEDIKNLCEIFRNNSIEISDINERFIEYYASECEFFLKISKNRKFIGVIKGRVEFKNINQVVLYLFLIDKDYQKKGLGSELLRQLVQFFYKSYGIYLFSAIITNENSEAMKFFEKNKYKLHRAINSKTYIYELEYMVNERNIINTK